jgi:hypothetical protein
MTTIADVAEALQTVLTQQADRAARITGFVQRTSKLGGAEFAQTLVFGWLANPDATLEELAQTAAMVGVSISPQGLAERFTRQAADCLQHLLSAAVKHLIRSDGVQAPLLERFTAIHVLDCTTIRLPKALAALWPGGGDQPAREPPAALKVALHWDLRLGSLDGLQLQAGRAQDQTTDLQTMRLPAGSLRVADLGFFALDVFEQVHADDAFWLSRLKVGTRVLDASGQVCDLKTLVETPGTATVDRPIQLGLTHRLPCRLIAVRVPPEVGDRRRQQLHAQARRKGQTVSQARLALADWTILVTNVPTERLSVAEAVTLARLRWQIELLFKLWKSHGKLDVSRSAKPWRILCEVYAKLLALLVQHWILLVSCWAYLDRSLVKAAKTVRAHAGYLAHAFPSTADLSRALTAIQRCLVRGCRINKRRANPAAYQLLLAATVAALA